MSIGANIKTMRKAKGLTQKNLADICGITRQSIYFIERGERRPSVRVAQRIADVLEFDWTEFYN